MKEFRPRLVATENTKFLIDLIREEGADAILARLQGGRESIDFNENDYVVTSQSERIKTVESLLEAAEVNTNIYEVERTLINKWDQHSAVKGLVELFQVKAWLRPKFLKPVDPQWLEKYIDALCVALPSAEPPTKPDLSKKPIVVAIADLHCGAFTKDLHLVPDYNVDELRRRMGRVSQTINEIGRPTYLKVLGDLIESFTGKNHKDTWKRIHMHGMEVALTVYDILLDFLQKTPYIVGVDIISGNHDRITSSNEDDSQGQVAYMVASLLKKHYKGITVNYDPLVLVNEYDGVCYIDMHGDKPISRKSGAQLAFDYGKQGVYNVIFMAHKHTEEVIEASSKHRVQRVPPMIPGDDYAQRLGEHSASGFLIAEANSVGTVDIQIKGL